MGDIELDAKKGRPPASELFDVHPVVLGGEPSDPKNKVWLSRSKHIEAVRYWNGVIGGLPAGSGSKDGSK
jgi:hypothetical protein